MTAYKSLGTTGNAAGVVTSLDHKLNLAAQLVKTTTLLGVRPGLFYNGNSTIISGTAGMAYSVIAYQLATQRSASAGAVLGGNDGTLSVATTAAPGSNSRIDITYHWNREYILDGVDSNPVIGVIQGTAAAVPVAPSLAAFPGAVEIGRATVAAGITATTSATITQTAPFTSVDGGTVAFRSTTEMNLWTTALTGQLARDISTDIMYRRTGSSTWVPDRAGALVCRVTRSTATPGVSSAAFTDLSDSANWSTTAPAAQNIGFATYSNGITIPVTGNYRVGFSLMEQANIALLVGFTVNKNSSVAATDLQSTFPGLAVQGVVAVSASTQKYFVAGDVVRLYGIAASGTPALDASKGEFYVEWLSAA